MAEEALASAWAALEQQNPGSPHRYLAQIDEMVPDSDEEPWSEARPLAQDALIALAYAIEATIDGEPQSAASCARHLYELVDQFVLLRTGLDLNDPDTEQKVVGHELVQSELQRQERDLADLRAAENVPHTQELVVRLRDRAKAEARTLLR